MTVIVLVASLMTFSVSGSAQTGPTLRQELQKHGLSITFDDADREITSFAVGSEDDWFGIAYYHWDGPQTDLRELRVRALDRRSGQWRLATLGRSERAGGSAVRLSRRAGWTFIDLHQTPSAGELLVLDDQLAVRRRLEGWSLLVLPDGRVVYHHNMVHFAPFHAAAVSVHDPRTGTNVRIHPAEPETGEQLRKQPKNRFVGEVTLDSQGELQIGFREEDLRWIPGQDATVPISAERHYTVVCSVSGRPRCRVDPP